MTLGLDFGLIPAGYFRCNKCGVELSPAGIFTHMIEGIRYCPSCAKELVDSMSEPKHDPVNHPKHYTNRVPGIECIEVTRHFNFNRGNSIKYVWRAGDKGDEIEDLRKAIWYLNDEVARLEKLRNGNKSS